MSREQREFKCLNYSNLLSELEENICFDSTAKSVQIRSFFWSVFSPNAGKYGPEKTLYLDTIYTVELSQS